MRPRVAAALLLLATAAPGRPAAAATVVVPLAAAASLYTGIGPAAPPPFVGQPQDVVFAPVVIGATAIETAIVYDLRPLAGATIAAATFSFDVVGAVSFASGPPRVQVSGRGRTTVQPTLADFFGEGLGGVSFLSGVLPATASRSAPVSFAIDATAMVRDLVAAGVPYATFVYTASGAGAQATIGAQSLAIVTAPAAVPEPSSLALCGVAGLAGAAWRRRLAA